MRVRASFVGVAAVAAWILASQSNPLLRAASTTLVISEFRTRGPSGGNDEFIEIRNVSGGTVNLNGLSILGSNGSGLTDTRANLANVTLGPGCSWLLVNFEHQRLHRSERSDLCRRHHG